MFSRVKVFFARKKKNFFSMGHRRKSKKSYQIWTKRHLESSSGIKKQTSFFISPGKKTFTRLFRWNFFKNFWKTEEFDLIFVNLSAALFSFLSLKNKNSSRQQWNFFLPFMCGRGKSHVVMYSTQPSGWRSNACKSPSPAKDNSVNF